MKKLRTIVLFIGCALILCSLGLLGFSLLHANRAVQDNAASVSQIQALLPPRSIGTMDIYSDTEMPVLQVGGKDFIGLVDIPAFGLTLPIRSSWDAGNVSSSPCRFWGSVYDGSLIVGGADQSGQFDCLDKIQNGDVVTVTDMTGAEFSYAVDRIDRSSSAQAQVLMNSPAHLTLFVRDAYNLNYIIVRCVSQTRLNP